MDRPGKALFLSAEDDADELHRRMADICEAEGRDLSHLPNLLYRSLAGQDALLAKADPRGALHPTPLYHALDREMAEHKPALLVLDTLADLHSGDENNRATARQFIGLLRGLAIRHGCAVLVLSHPSLTGMSSGSGLSGSTAWNGSVRSRLYLERVTQEGYEADPDARVLRTKKSNYGPTGGEMALRWQDGVFVAEAAETGLDRMAASAKAERVFLKLLTLFTQQGRRVNSKNGPGSAPSTFEKHPYAEGVRKRAFASAMEKLLASGRIRVAEEGPPSRRVSYLEVVE